MPDSGTFAPIEISETRIVGSFSYPLYGYHDAYNVYQILQLCPCLKWLVLRYCTPRPLHVLQSTNFNWIVGQQVSLKHMELDQCAFDTLHWILACCPKLLHLKFKMIEYPEIATFQQLASTLTTVVPLLSCLHCSYIVHSNSQDPYDYRIFFIEYIRCTDSFNMYHVMMIINTVHMKEEPHGTTKHYFSESWVEISLFLCSDFMY